MEIFYIIMCLAIGLVATFILSFVLFFVLSLKKYKILPAPEIKLRKKSIFKRIFIEFPRQFWIDKFEQDPDFFPMFGFHLFHGEQGSGKTIALTEMLMRLKEQYPKVKISTNYGYKYQDSEIKHWKDIVFDNNGIYGKIEVIDEIQNWFNSLQSKDFPIEMITEISQQRKQKKIIIGTSQVFNRVAKPIREKVNFLYQPVTVFGCLTIVKVFKPGMDDNAQVKELKRDKTYFFVHSKEIRNAFDTYRKIEKMSKEGFSPRAELTASSSPIVIGAEKGGSKK